MAKKGKVVSMFLLDGDTTSCIKVQIKNWNGMAYKVAKTKIVDYKERDDFNRNGVYFLFGKDAVYIGQAGTRQTSNSGVAARLLEHTKNPEKSFWTEAVFFVTTDDSFGQTELSYLENKFYEMACEYNTYKVMNANKPTAGNIVEEKEAELDEFSSYAELILDLLGYKVFQKVEQTIPVAIPTPKPVEPKPPKGENTNKPKVTIPALPDRSLKIGEYVYTAMNNLSKSGYTFTEEEIDAMCTEEWSKEHFKRTSPFMKKYEENDTDLKYKGYVRFKDEIYTFGTVKVLITKEWFERGGKTLHRDRFDAWYKSLK